MGSSSAMGSATANAGSVTAGDDMVNPQESSHNSDAPVDAPWPAETDLLLVSGSNKVMLTVQRPLMRAVLQDTFERIRAAMVFKTAFPNVFETIDMITDNLIIAAEKNERATNIYNRLVIDGDYTTNMSRLVSLWIRKAMLMLFTLFSAPRSHPSFS